MVCRRRKSCCSGPWSHTLKPASRPPLGCRAREASRGVPSASRNGGTDDRGDPGPPADFPQAVQPRVRGGHPPPGSASPVQVVAGQGQFGEDHQPGAVVDSASSMSRMCSGNIGGNAAVEGRVLDGGERQRGGHPAILGTAPARGAGHRHPRRTGCAHRVRAPGRHRAVTSVQSSPGRDITSGRHHRRGGAVAAHGGFAQGLGPGREPLGGPHVVEQFGGGQGIRGRSRRAGGPVPLPAACADRTVPSLPPLDVLGGSPATKLPEEEVHNAGAHRLEDTGRRLPRVLRQACAAAAEVRPESRLRSRRCSGSGRRALGCCSCAHRIRTYIRIQGLPEKHRSCRAA